MHTLTPVLQQPGDAAIPTARLVLKNGKETYLCDEFEQVVKAMDEGKPFLAHEVIGLKPSDLVVNPSAVATVARAA